MLFFFFSPWEKKREKPRHNHDFQTISETVIPTHTAAANVTCSSNAHKPQQFTENIKIKEE